MKREPGWYWVQINEAVNEWTPMYWTGEEFLESACSFTEEELAKISEKPIHDRVKKDCRGRRFVNDPEIQEGGLV